MPTLSNFAFYSGFTLPKTCLDVLFRSTILHCFVLTLMAFFSSVSISGPSGLLKAFPIMVNLVSEGVLLPTSFRVCEFVEAVGLFQIICQCAFEDPWSF